MFACPLLDPLSTASYTGLDEKRWDDYQFTAYKGMF
jgi:hypothetical protein